MTDPRTAEIQRLAGLLLVLLALGWLLGHVAAFLVLGLGGYLLWHLNNLFKLEHWLRQGANGYPPETRGIWDEIFNYVYRLQERYRRRKQKLTSYLTQFEESTSAMPDATVILDGQSRIAWFNRAAQRLLGLRPGQDRGQRIDNLLRQPVFIGYLAHGDYNEAVEMVSPADESLQLSLRIVPYGKEQRLLLARDVTRITHLERIRRDFVTNVSHELRTPLTVLSGYLETLAEGGLAEEAQARAIKVMELQASRMRHIVEDLLLLSRLENSKSQDDRQPVAVAVLLTSIAEDARLLSGENRHVVSLEAEPKLYLRGNENELYSAFSNLAFNAVKYTPAQGRITLRWYGDEDGAHFEVVDTGIGIPPQHIPRLTERFFRVDVGRSRDMGGTGLGLAIVKHVLGRHDAQLHIESEPDQGSLFRCNFPARRAVRK